MTTESKERHSQPIHKERSLETIELDLASLLTQIEQAHAQTKEDVQAAKELYDSLEAAINQTEESWSCSWIGYHADLYFGNFERPGRRSQFNVEWGGINGIPEGWNERTYLEVSQHIESLSKSSLSTLEQLSHDVHNRVRPLYQDARALVTPILENAGNASKELLEDIQNEKWGVSQAAYLRQARPGEVFTRDSRAIAQGLRVPPHIMFRSKVISEYSRITASMRALEQSMLGIKQARTALRIAVRSTDNEAPKNSPSSPQSRLRRWLMILIMAALALETFILIRPFTIEWFDSTFTQDFLIQPTRLGFSPADLLANALAALILTPFAWIAQWVYKWSRDA